jgi:DNA-directed RNA polymerase specialized sigma24 family protein
VTRWLPGLQRGDREAMSALWGRYFAPLVQVAEARLRGAPCGVAGGEDVVVEAFLSFCDDVQKEGRFPDLSSRDNLMRLLVRFTVCKAFDFRAKAERRRRVLRGGSALGEAGADAHAGDEPPPEFQAQVADLLAKLPDDELRAVARLRMEGHSNADVAAALGCAVATVERKLARIRGVWKKDWAALRGQDTEG